MRNHRGVLSLVVFSFFVTSSALVAQPLSERAVAATGSQEQNERPAEGRLLGSGTPRLSAEDVVTGDHGDIYMTSPAPFTATGIVLQSKPSWPYIVLKTGTATTGSGVVFYDSLNNALFSVIGDGSVGIRTSLPVAPLDVNVGIVGANVREIARFGSGDAGNSVGGGAFISLGNSSLVRVGQVTTAGQANLFFSTYNGGSGPEERLRITGAGSVGIGTKTPGSRLAVQQSSDPVMGTDSTDAARVYNTSATSFAQLQVNANAAELSSSGTNMLPLYLNAGRRTTPAVAVLVNGNVGIGTTAPTEKVEIAGNLRVTGIITGARVINATFQDIAEWVPAEEPLEAGMVVVVGGGNTVRAASEAYDTRVAGVVSAQPGVLLGVEGPEKVMVATTGRVKVRVDATTMPIREGDLLVSSGQPGIAMRSQPMDINGRKFHQPGTLIGKALEPLATGTGEILVLLSMQ
jgi:hypothetical protein